MCIENLNQFIKWTAQFNAGDYLFRGVSKDCYKIEPSTYRRLPSEEDKNPTQLLKINKDLINKARTLGHDQKNGQELSNLELLAELQHFGAATCLIDFTRSALVALWFACQQSSKGEANGKVFAVRSGNLTRFKIVTPDLIKKEIDYFFSPDENRGNLLYQWQPKLQNNRIIAQQSVFLFGSAQIKAEAECVILKNSKKVILTSLYQSSSIVEASMYPDFEGFAHLHAHNKPYIKPDAQAYLEHGRFAVQSGNLEAAISAYTQVILLAPDPAFASVGYNNRGLTYLHKGDNDSALADFNKAIELKFDNPVPRYYRGIMYLRSEKWDQARADLTTARDTELNIVDIFHYDYESVNAFEIRYGVQLPEDIATMLTPSS